MKPHCIFATASLVVAACAPLAAQSVNSALSEKPPAIKQERAVALARACKDFIDSKDSSTVRFEELGLEEVDDGALPHNAESARTFKASDAKIFIAVHYVLAADGKWKYQAERQKVVSCSAKFYLASYADSQTIMKTISALVGEKWVNHGGRYIIEYKKNRFVQITTMLSDYLTTVHFTKKV